MRSVLAILGLVSCASSADPVIRVDQVGYPSDGAKRAVVALEAIETFSVVAGDGKTVLEAKLSDLVIDAASGDRVRIADFSAIDAPGVYELRAGSDAARFAIAADPHRALLRTVVRSYYGQRCGAAVDLAPDHPGYGHAACHLAAAFHASSGRSGPAATGGGWHDAGDYGRYVVNSGITTGTLLWAWELYPETLRGIDLAIPESSNATPDFLDEVRWNLEWMLAMQDADGGVWHKQTSLAFPSFVMPEDDDATSFVIGRGTAPFKTSCATANLAAVAAIASRVYGPYDEAFAGRAAAAALRAWEWLAANPSAGFRNPAGVSTGEYGDADCGDERLWAAAEIWRATGDEAAHAYFLARLPRALDAIGEASPPGWSAVAALGSWTYALSGRGDACAADAIRRKSAAAAGRIAARALSSAYGHPLTPDDWVWGSNGVVANYALQLLVADALRPDPRYRGAALEILHYLLGRNAFGLSFVTGAGARAVRHPHHRPSGADDHDAPWPGLLAGGPNRDRNDPVLQALPKDLPPARVYADVEDSYASNEVAINWNAPLVFVLAGLSEDSDGRSRRDRPVTRCP